MIIAVILINYLNCVSFLVELFCFLFKLGDCSACFSLGGLSCVWVWFLLGCVFIILINYDCLIGCIGLCYLGFVMVVFWFVVADFVCVYCLFRFCWFIWVAKVVICVICGFWFYFSVGFCLWMFNWFACYDFVCLGLYIVVLCLIVMCLGFEYGWFG